MTLHEAERILRTGLGPIRPIIDWLAVKQDAASLLHLLHDEETRPSVLYVFSELPTNRISSSVREAVGKLLPLTGEGTQERGWAENVLS